MAEKKWKKPELFVISRSRPEEYVLVTCKSHTTTPGGPNGATTCTQSGGGSGKYCNQPNQS